MALDKLVDSSQLNGALTSTANAIRTKTGGTDPLAWDMDDGFEVAVGGILTPTDGSIPTKTSSDLTVSGATVTAPAGYYATNTSKSVASGSATTPATTVTANPAISVNSSGLITATASATKSVTPTVSAGYVSSGTAGTITVSGSNTSQLSTQGAKTVAPTESEQTAVAAGKYTTGAVKVGAISTTYVGSGIARNDSDDLTVDGATVTVPAGYYADDASKSVSNGSVTQNAPTVNSSGLVTATSTVTAGYVGADTKSNTLQLSTLGAQTKYATTSDQTISTTGKYMTGNVTVKKLTSTNYSAANIKNGVTIKVNNSNADVFAVAGTFTKASTVSSGQTAAAAGNIMQGYSAWVDGAEVKGSMSTVSVNEGTTTVSGDTATRGTASWDAGVIPAGSIGAATFANTATTGTTYVDISATTDAPVLVTGDYLYINKGYTDNLKISLARLVPDGASAGLASSHILNGYSAYNNDGTLIAGNIATLASGDITVSGRTVTIPLQKYTGASGATKVTKSIGVGTVTSGTASITSLTRVYNSTNGNFDITGSADVSAPTVGTAGYVSSSEGTKSKNTGGATVTATVAKIVGATTITGTTTKTPSIAKQAISISGVTDAASGDATTTAPSSGVYIAVKSAASTGTLTATPSVTTAGYGDATNHGIAAKTATVGANASAVTYVPITTGAYSSSVASQGTNTAAAFTPKVTGTIADISTTTAPTSGTDGTDYWTITPGGDKTTGKARAKATATIGTAGYIPTGSSTTSSYTTWDITTNVNAGTARYIPKAVIAGSSTNATATTTVAPGTVSISKQSTPSGVTNAASGNATTTAPSSGVYVAVKATAAANSTGTTSSISGSGTATVTGAGYAPTTLTGTVSVSGTATAKTSAKDSSMTYVPITTVSGSIGGTASGGSATAAISNVNSMATITDISGKTAGTEYFEVKATATGTAGSYTPKYTVSTAGWIGSTVTGTAQSVSVSNDNIGQSIYIPAASYSGSVVSASVNVAPTVTYSLDGTVTSIGTETQPSGTDGTDYWTITPSGTVVNGQARSRGRATIGAAGYVKTGYVQSGYKTVTITPTVTEGTNRYIPKATIAGSSTNATATTTVAPGTVSISKQSTPSGVTNAASGDATTTAPSSGVYVAVKATAAANSTGTTSAISGSGTATVTGAGYAPTTLTGTVSVSGTATAKTSAKDSSMTYVPITTGAITNNTTLPSGTSSSGTINRGSYIKISAGYHVSDKYYLAQNVSNGTITNNTTLPSGSSSSGTINHGSYIKIGAGYYSADKYYQSQSVSEGTITNNTSGGTSSGTINWGKQIKIGAGNYASDVYYTAQAAPSGTLSITTSHNAQTNIDVQAKQYVNITGLNVPKDKAFTLTATADTALDTSSNITVTSAAYRKLVVTNAANGTATITNNGTIDSLTNAGTITAITNNASKTITNIANSGTVKVSSGSATAGTLTVSAYNSSGTAENDKSIVSNGKWVATTVSAAGTFYGRVTVGAGTITNNTSGGTSSGTINRGSQIKIGKGYYASDTYYTAQDVANGTITNNTSGGTSSGTINRGKQIKIGAGYYANDAYYTAQSNSGTLTISASGTTSCDGYANVSVAAGTVTNSTTLPSGKSSSGTCSRGKYVKIGAGYYPNDLYYLAQNNSGTLTVSTSHNAATNISCNGKTNVNVTGIYVPAGKSFTVRVPDGSSTVDFVFTVDSSGNVTIS